MSVITTSPCLVAPSKSDYVNLDFSGGSFVFSGWSEVIAATTADIAVAGVSFSFGDTYAGFEAEIDIGVGTAGNEVSIGSLIRLYGPNSGNPVWNTYFVKVPISGIVSGQRVSIRGRGTGGGPIVPFGILYYNDYDGDTLPNLTCSPLGAVSTSITPNAGVFANSAWFVVFNGVNHEISLAALVPSNSSDSVDVEWDIGVGSPGSEVVLTTLRSAEMSRDSGGLWFIDFPALYPVPANSIISVRMRKSGTDVAHTWNAAIQYYDSTNFLSGTITVNKITSSDTDTTIFNFTAGGGLSPGSFNLANGESQVFNNVPLGSGYSIAENPNNSYTTVITVSNGDDPSNITLDSGESIVVDVYNSANTVGSGIYYLVRDKKDDTLFNTITGGAPPTYTTRRVKIP